MPAFTDADFAALAADARPRLHRYCARMMGSAFAGEDVVQDALAKALVALPGAGELDSPRAWLFRIAHNTALDALRRRQREAAMHADEDASAVADETADSDARVAAKAALSLFLHLPPAQRAIVILADVLGHALAEIAGMLDMTLAAVKAALHRGRATLRGLSVAPVTRRLDVAEQARLAAYTARFNARDFDALRLLLADDVKLDLVNRTRLAGARDVGVYFTRYAGERIWHVALGLAEGGPALLYSDPADPSGAVAFIVLLDWDGERIAGIRDFHYARYVMDGLELVRFAERTQTGV